MNNQNQNDGLFKDFESAIGFAKSLKSQWPKRAVPACNNAVKVLKQFIKGEAFTDETKVQFKIVAGLIHEVKMSDSQAEAVLRLAEVAHAAVHFGQLFTSMSHQGEIHRDYDELQKNYVLYGIKGARNLRDWAVRSAPDVTLKNLYDDFWDVLNSAEDNLDWAWEDRVESFAKKCIDVLKDFVRGEATTDDTKAQFKRMSTLFHEVSMSEAQVAAVLSLSELAHAAAHIGILTASMSHRGHIHRLYDFYQKGYVVYGIEMARLFIEKAESIWEDDDSEEDDESHPW